MHEGPVNSCYAGSKPNVFVTVSRAERRLLVWQVSPESMEAKVTEIVKANKETLLGCAIAADGRRIASCAIDGSVYLFKRPETALEAEAKDRAKREKEELRERMVFLD